MKHQTPDSMKFRKLQRRLGCSRVLLVGTLELLWIAVQKNCPQGDIGRHTNEEIAIECDWEGDPDDLVEALVETGWLDPCDTHRLIVHDWADHSPGWLKRQLRRHNKSFVTPSSLLTVTNDRQEATPNLTQPNLTQPKQATLASPEPAEPDSEPPVLKFPCVGDGPKEYFVTQSLIDEHRELYPGVDVLDQWRRALAWVLAQPERRKTYRGMRKYLNGWLSRATNTGSGNRGSPSKPARTTIDFEELAKRGTP